MLPVHHARALVLKMLLIVIIVLEVLPIKSRPLVRKINTAAFSIILLELVGIINHYLRS